MLQPELVADCMAAIRAGLDAAGASATRTSVKCRLGVDDDDSYGQLAAFVHIVSTRGGVRQFVVHSRKCLLNGLSPAQNRSVPPLRHDWVWALKRDFPHLSFQVCVRCGCCVCGVHCCGVCVCVCVCVRALARAVTAPLTTHTHAHHAPRTSTHPHTTRHTPHATHRTPTHRAHAAQRRHRQHAGRRAGAVAAARGRVRRGPARARRRDGG
jgi:hypothetical protein